MYTSSNLISAYLRLALTRLSRAGFIDSYTIQRPSVIANYNLILQVTKTKYDVQIAIDTS